MVEQDNHRDRDFGRPENEGPTDGDAGDSETQTALSHHLRGIAACQASARGAHMSTGRGRTSPCQTAPRFHMTGSHCSWLGPCQRRPSAGIHLRGDTGVRRRGAWGLAFALSDAVRSAQSAEKKARWHDHNSTPQEGTTQKTTSPSFCLCTVGLLFHYNSSTLELLSLEAMGGGARRLRAHQIASKNVEPAASGLPVPKDSMGSPRMGPRLDSAPRAARARGVGGVTPPPLPATSN